jgi:dihydroorotase
MGKRASVFTQNYIESRTHIHSQMLQYYKVRCLLLCYPTNNTHAEDIEETQNKKEKSRRLLHDVNRPTSRPTVTLSRIVILTNLKVPEHQSRLTRQYHERTRRASQREEKQINGKYMAKEMRSKEKRQKERRESCKLPRHAIYGDSPHHRSARPRTVARRGAQGACP